jgi:DNA-directed RNA polymerase subunit RPC12/RpoP
MLPEMWRPGKVIYTIYYSLLSMICPKCQHEWDYKGKSALYVTCPHCYRKIHAEPATTQPIKHSVNTGLTPEEIAVLDRTDTAESAVTTKLPGTSCCGMWDKFYECPDCGVVLELFKSDRAPIICPCCESRRLKLHNP